MPINNIPEQDPHIFMMPVQADAVTFAQEETDNRIELTLYDGSIARHWYWGNLAFDMETMKLAKSKVPILLDHDTDQRIGFSTQATFDKKFILSGKLLKSSSLAQDIRSQAKEGFPFESSLRFDPTRSIIENVPEGQQVTVNGHTLKGPGTVIKQAVIMEGSVTTFGALSNTKSQIFNKPEKESTMDKPMTIDQFKASQPELYASIVQHAKADAEASMRADFDRYCKIAGSDHDIAIQAFNENLELDKVIELKTARLAEREQSLATREAQAVSTSKAATKADDAQAKAEFAACDDQARVKAADQKKFDPENATDAELAAHFNANKDIKDQFSCAEAYIACIRNQ